MYEKGIYNMYVCLLSCIGYKDIICIMHFFFLQKKKKKRKVIIMYVCMGTSTANYLIRSLIDMMSPKIIMFSAGMSWKTCGSKLTTLEPSVNPKLWIRKHLVIMSCTRRQLKLKGRPFAD